MDYRIFPPDDILETTIDLPLSKSMAMRAIALNWLAEGKVPFELLNICADTAVFGKCLSESATEKNCGASGAALRFLIAMVAATPGMVCTIGGIQRLNQRPIGPLVEALRAIGASVDYLGDEGFAPVKVCGCRLNGGTVEVDASISSQIVSALMLIAPKCESDLVIKLLGNVQSAPYIRMTAGMMQACGAEVELERDSVKVSAKPYTKDDYIVEPDWSAASFWYEIAALTAGWVTLSGLTDKSLQGDRGVVSQFERLGVLTEFTCDGAELSATPDLYNSLDADMTDMPDAVPALVVTAAMAGIPFRLSGVGALHDKECDRVSALAESLAKLGIITDTEQYGTVFVWDGRRVPIRELPVFDTFGDHRMAMALAAVAVFVPGIVIKDVEVVDKSYPSFWDDLRKAGFTLLDPSETPDTES